jgi:ABC-type multidrug transport system ATPase subunit
MNEMNSDQPKRRRRSGEQSTFRSTDPEVPADEALLDESDAPEGSRADEGGVPDDSDGSTARRSAGKRKSRSQHTGHDLAINCTGLSKTYGDLDALAELDLEVPDRQAIVLVGHNGSGKSTLLNLIAGTLEPTSGAVEIHGHAPESMPARAQRSWLPDTPVLYDDLTVDEHLEYVSRLHGVSDAGARIDELVERLGLAERRDQLPAQFSRGLRQKTAIAVAMCRPFSVLLVDEPFVGLDASGRATMLELLAEAADGGATLVVATHDPDVIDRFQRGLLMSNGELIHDGDASELHALLAADLRRDS